MTEQSEKQELERLLASPHLAGKRVREALRYLCEQYWAGEPVTQYDLSQKLYDTSDNSVAARNLVKSLRQKLALHYGGEGGDSRVRLVIPSGQYTIVFEEVEAAGPREGSPAQPGNGRTHPSRGLLAAMAALVLLTVLVVTLLPGFMESRRPAASLVVIDGRTVIGQSADQPELWRSEFPAAVFKAMTLDKDSVNRFIVLYGGVEPPQSEPAEVTPQVAILSPRGETLATLDLLDFFNPFEKTHDPHYFRFGFSPVGEDFDLDGHKDVLLSCKHLYYPNIVYAVSGGKLEITGAFANSGKVKALVFCKAPPGAPTCAVAGLAINNRMGEQLSVFIMPKSLKSVSPDFDATSWYSVVRYRPTGLVQAAVDPLTQEEGHLLRVMGSSGQTLLLDPLALSFETDPWFGSGPETDVFQDSLERFYSQVREARRLVRDGVIDEGLALYDRAISEALDEPLRLYALLDAARTLKASGEPRLALDLLPSDPSEMVFPRRVMLLRGELLTILVDYEAAKEAFRESNYLHYSFSGYVQADILGGANGEDLYLDILGNYPSKMNIRATRAWLKIPSLLRGECTMADSGQDNAHLLAGDLDTREDHIRYEQETAIWNAFIDLELGLKPRDWPDENRRPMEYGDAFHLKMLALDACRERAENGPAAALPRLESAYRTLARAALTDHEVQIPFVLVAYACGFAASENGREELAREALNDAVKRFPHGRKFERASRILSSTEAAD